MARVQQHLPLRERHGLVPAGDVALDPHVNHHLAHALWDWCRQQDLQTPQSGGEPSQRTLSARAHRMCATIAILVGDYIGDLEDFVLQDPDVLLDMVDWILRDNYRESSRSVVSLSVRLDPFGRARVANAIDDIRSLLLDAGSAWKVAKPPDHLELRVPESLEEEYKNAVNFEDEPGRHLAKAWDAAWRRNDASTVEAYDAAVKAIEAVLIPIVIPNDPTATLGNVVSALRDKPKKWDTRFRGAETVEALTAMLDELWKAHCRHASMDTKQP